MAHEQSQSNNLHKSPELQGTPKMEFSNPTLCDVRQQPVQQTDANGTQQYQMSNKDWDPTHQAQRNSQGTNVNNMNLASGINSSQNLVNESFVTVPSKRIGNTDLSASTGFQNTSSIGQFAVKMPPGFNGVNNGISSNTGNSGNPNNTSNTCNNNNNNSNNASNNSNNGEFNSRASFSHGTDNVPIAVGSGFVRSNSISMIPQSSHMEESLTFQQTQQSLYGPSFGHSFLATSPPPRNSKNNLNFGGMHHSQRGKKGKEDYLSFYCVP